MKDWEEHLRFLSVNRRDPVAILLAAAAAILLLFIAAELVKGLLHGRLLHRLWHETVPQVSAPAGLDTADFSADGLELSGWAPPDAMVRILDHGREVAEDQADDTGIWDLSFSDDEHRTFRVLDIFWRESDKLAGEMGRLSLLAPGPSADDAYVWLQDSENADPRLLQSPDAEGKGDLFLTLAQTREGGTLLLEGQAVPHSLVQLYADNQLAGAATADADGRWMLSTVTSDDKKQAALRLDEIYKASVRERRAYKFVWPEVKNAGTDQAAMLQTNNEGWVVSEPVDNGRALFAIFKPDAGVPMPPGKAIPGQMIPVAETGEK